MMRSKLSKAKKKELGELEKEKNAAAAEKKRIEDENYKGPRTFQEQLAPMKDKIIEHRKSLAKRENAIKIFKEKHPDHAKRQAANQNHVDRHPYKNKDKGRSQQKPFGRK